MQGVALLVALSALSVDHTWRQTEDGRVEYVLQIEPVFLSALAEGKEIASELPAEVRRVDRLCIRIGSGNLQRLAKTAPDWPELDEAAHRAAGTPPPDAPLAVFARPGGELYKSYDLTHGWEPATDTGTTYLLQISPELLELLKDGDEIYADVFPEAGEVRGFKITSGRDAVTRRGVRPAVVPATRVEDQGRSSSPAADIPATSDFTGGSGGAGSIYGGIDTTELAPAQPGTNPAPGASNRFGQPASPVLQPPARAQDDQWQFDRSKFAGAAAPTTTGSSSARPASRSTGAAAATRTPTPPEDNPYAYEEDRAPRVASRTTATAGLAQNQLSRPTTEAAGDTREKGAEFPGWVSLLLVCALFASLGGNLYMIWTSAEYYHRYKLAIERLRSAGRN